MQRILLFIPGAFFLLGPDASRAIDISPSKDTVPRSAWDSGGNKFSIFNGDPKRIQRANQVDPKSFDLKVAVAPLPLSVRSLKAAPSPSFKITFSVHNHAKKTYTLSFPTAQRWDFRITNSSGALVYSYSDTCQFVQTVGSSMVNQDDRLVYSENVELEDLTSPLVPGVYTVQAIVANYPEMTSSTQFTVQD